MQELREQQLQFELESDAAAAASRLKALREQALEGHTALPRASRFIANAYAKVQAVLEAEAAVVRRGPGAKFGKWLRALNMETAAVISIRECIRILSGSTVRCKPATVQLLAGSMGRLFEMEIRISEAEKVNPLYMRKVHAQIKERNSTNAQHISGVYGKAYSQIMHDEGESKLSATEVVQLGKFGLQACMAAGMVQLVKAWGKGGKMFYYEMPEEVHAFLTDYSNSDVRDVMDAGAGAMRCPPDPWTHLLGGGYLSERRKRASPLMSLHGIRTSERRRLKDEFTAERMPELFEAVNYLQSIPLEVHTPTFEAVLDCWNQGGGILGVPKRTMPEKPAFPYAEDWSKASAPSEELDVFHQWKRKTMLWHDAKREWSSKVKEVGGFIKTVQNIQGPLWLPAFWDTRGRTYYRGSPNPQGSDIAKSILHLHNKQPLGERGLYWLRVAVANSFGFDKKHPDIKEQWTRDNWESIQRALAAPLDNKEALGEDSPWLMFSAAYTLSQALASGAPEMYCTGYPVHMDATCSGLQHFSAILRDRVGGEYVNLFDAGYDEKRDIYSKVLQDTLEGMRSDLECPVNGLYADLWLGLDLGRSYAKKPVMTYVYGATLAGCAEYVQAQAEQDFGCGVWPEGVSGVKASFYLSKKLFQGIESTVPAAAALMRWLRARARKQPRGKRMQWRTKLGFLVQHDYQAYEEKTCYIRSCGVRETLVREFTDDTRPRSMQNAIAPNFVHALDATHMLMVVLELKRLGTPVVVIHDSYGTLPCYVETMHRVIREQFQKLYEDGQVLVNFLRDIEQEVDLPEVGDLGLHEVLNSPFFFC